jgi:hypothetical protein
MKWQVVAEDEMAGLIDILKNLCIMQIRAGTG